MSRILSGNRLVQDLLHIEKAEAQNCNTNLWRGFDGGGVSQQAELE